MLPNFLIIGAPRAGTTWIDRNLRRHPDVFMPSTKELHFFDRHYDRGMTYYECQFAGYSGQSAVGEATPDYLHGQYTTNDVPALIHQHLPNVKLIVSLRNPVDRAYSRYWNSKAKYAQNAQLTFEQKLAQRPEFIREGFYYDQLMRYLALFSRQQLLVLLYDDLASNPRMFMRQIYEFIGVDSTFQSGAEDATINAAAGKQGLARSKLAYVLYRGLLRFRLHGTAERVRLANSVEIPPMNAETRSKLVAMYREKNLQLQELIQQDLSAWNTIPP